MDITIRRIVPEDAPVLASLARQTFYDTFTGTCTEKDMQEYLETYYSLEQVQQELDDPLDLYFFATMDDKPVGYIRFMEDYRGLPQMKQWKALELKRLYVSKEYHGMGIAQALMDFYIAHAIQNGYTALWLGVWEYNFRAQRFYQKYGFEDSGHTHDFPIGNTPQTDKWYWRFL